MPIDIRTAGYQKRERVAAPLDVYNSTLNTLQQKHDTAIETSNQIKTFLANKQLNEAENEWLDKYSRDVNAQIEASAQEGSYATALTTARRLAGEVASNPGLIGRERYQQEFKNSKMKLLIVMLMTEMLRLIHWNRTNIIIKTKQMKQAK